MLRYVFAAALLVVGSCNLNKDDDENAGICVHSTTKQPKLANCTIDTGLSNVYTYCTDEKIEKDCKNLSAACSNPSSLAEYNDTIVWYKGKKCAESGYTETCASNSLYKASNQTFCPQ
jgi:hypothetical protein